ncbi:uncharacterized protein L969DRAFT_609063 [Mixia osmundae IAM 14324]|uniref:Mitochondrial import receptor subunit TOM40 n=1 Tax=Mixia osmundae (strain CBS 9802 / IAM 14324 / JCM 22182 / KY 12970) TaxID=764103 RepID=G7DV16_MIXOS|nr:uncharacterized protein L969DRAFT_609063 [Mixia osmundae IAM 14324]KEI37241.1 hypothetical protein L969DRAFT_609063 [Mixia osmundae IAM 14324]GAA94426.1 hypothetical protein E5Q_01078 [Mixia osmundae IAM 14324]
MASSSRQGNPAATGDSYYMPGKADSDQFEVDLKAFPTASSSSTYDGSWWQRKGLNPFAASTPLGAMYHKFESWRAQLDLPPPGSIENLGRETKNVMASSHCFEGARADLAKAIGLSPPFQITHSFTLGGPTASSAMDPAAGKGGSYQFSSFYAPQDLLLQGNIDQEGAVSGRANYSISPSDILKLQLQLSPNKAHNTVQLEHDRQSGDYALNFKAYNASLADATGIYTASYLQSISQSVALGAEVVWQRPQGADIEEAGINYYARLAGKNRSWLGSAFLINGSILNATYYQKINDKVDLGAELTIVPHPIPAQRQSSAALGVRYEFRAASVRAQLDSKGKVSMYLDQRITPAFGFLVSGEIDHVKNSSKWGIGVMVESQNFTEAEIAAAGMGPPQPSV